MVGGSAEMDLRTLHLMEVTFFKQHIISCLLPEMDQLSIQKELRNSHPLNVTNKLGSCGPYFF